MGSSNPFRVLCLDGGGMRGIYQAAYLDSFFGKIDKTKTSNADIGQAFDLVVGTSTGGIIACALAQGVKLDEVTSLYRQNGHKIFPYQKLRANSCLGLVVRSFAGQKKGEQALKAALAKVFGTTTFSEMYKERGIALAIPTVDLNRHASVVFKTPHLARLNGRDNTRQLTDACIATSAAPILRSIANLPEPENTFVSSYFVDGGLWANNPGLVGLIEANEILMDRKEDERSIHLFMLGSLPPPQGEELSERHRHRGALGWKFGLKALDASMNAQSVANDYLARKMGELRGKDDIVFRLPSRPASGTLQTQLVNMDDARPHILNALVRQALSDVEYAWSSSEKGVTAFKSALEEII
ncbi:MAG: CBASS cGAMP-activated phospholipase [Halothiobacillus sp.]|jgi:hypothetical protein|nr:CBASS cGAMP-activated phospholipase [Halothiobacillus sp.]